MKTTHADASIDGQEKIKQFDKQTPWECEIM